VLFLDRVCSPLFLAGAHEPRLWQKHEKAWSAQQVVARKTRPTTLNLELSPADNLELYQVFSCGGKQMAPEVGVKHHSNPPLNLAMKKGPQ
jgi:hypothetical protein